MGGTFNNIFTVGRDFLFEVSENKRYRIFGFSLKSVFTLLANYVGPYVGFKIYKFTNNDFNSTCQWVSYFFLVAAIIFFILFTVMPHDPDPNPKTK